MKILNLFNMGLILSGLALTVCDNDGRDTYRTPKKIEVATECSNEYIQLFSFNVTARNWRTHSATDRYVEVSIPAITDKLIKDGAVLMYLNEAGKNLSLPFTYYQVRRALSFQPSYEQGRAYINILGNFILSINTSYTFRILVVNAKGLKQFKGLNWYNYDEIKYVLNFENLK